MSETMAATAVIVGGFVYAAFLLVVFVTFFIIGYGWSASRRR